MIKQKIKGGVLATVGYILSPLSWWNDILVNIPIAYAFGFLFGLISKSLFFPAMIIAYWGTNILGFILIHKGASEIFSKTEKKYAKKEFLKDLLISIIYTSAILALVKLGILKFPGDYFQ
ncbi:MAG: hypothetical protein MUD10_04630 [Candidatus Pacebacteria bacterium]|jgi:hypothetical protein|nr:hypothetical protein [Candidatus Paceibacterota bacterium]